MAKSRKPPAATEIRILRLPHAAGLPPPAYQSLCAAGFDLLAAVPAGTPPPVHSGHHPSIPPSPPPTCRQPSPHVL